MHKIKNKSKKLEEQAGAKETVAKAHGTTVVLVYTCCQISINRHALLGEEGT